ncbi:PQQ-dependent catabolism-associated CXXCW motif protein [Rhodobacteraceae bacterium NNCM2]|nr:PQQ-dependent catabolism-associated CXXCW motif protein [Coraliihabitans acroporae]
MRWLLLALLMIAPAAQAGNSDEPADYRMEAYRAPVPETLKGARVVDDEGARALWEAGGVAFIDVFPRAPKPENLPEGTIWREKDHYSIPGAIWLPNVGYGALAAETHAYFQRSLDAATKGNKDHPVLFFCLAGCWMSWNAGKRAQEYGYTNVIWYPDGTDGWDFVGYPLEPVERSE